MLRLTRLEVDGACAERYGRRMLDDIDAAEEEGGESIRSSMSSGSRDVIPLSKAANVAIMLRNCGSVRGQPEKRAYSY